MLNVITLIGRLVGDPELRKTNSDKSVANFTIAVDNPLKESDGTRGTCFLDCKVLGSVQAENLVKFTKKGDRIGISGSLNQRNFVRQDGSKGRVYEVIVDSIEYLEPREEVPDQEEVPTEEATPKFDPMTGKPLKPNKK